MKTEIEETTGYKLAIMFKPFINPKCTDHMEIVKGLAKSINSAIYSEVSKSVGAKGKIFHHGYEEGKKWQKNKQKEATDLLIEQIEKIKISLNES
jgi:hypothetical protein